MATAPIAATMCGSGLEQGEEKRPVWLGAATRDRGVGISRYTGAITHHIDADIDAEREQLATDLESAGMVDAKYQVTGVGLTVSGRNGGGDLYYTDGEVWILRLVVACHKRTGPAAIIPSPPATELKDQIWHAITNALGKCVKACTGHNCRHCAFNRLSPCSGLNFLLFPCIPSEQHSHKELR